MSFPDYKIIETEQGPMISHSRKSVYDVMLSQKEGDDFFAICVIHGLRPVQVQIALEYIEAHRTELEPDLEEIIKKKAERQAYYEAIAAEIQKRIAQLPMTPERAVFNALKEKHRHRWEKNGTTSHSW